MHKRTLIALIVAVSAMTPLAHARGKKPVLTPGTYKEWGQDIDQIEIVKTFKAADYSHIVIAPFDTSKAPLPDKNEKWYGTLKAALASYNQSFTEAFEKELKTKVDVTQADSSKQSKTLLIRGVVEDLDPGSRAGRYFAGYGAGAASTKLSLEIVDAKTGDVLVRVTQARRSGGTFKFGGGSDLEVMRDSIHAAGKDIAHVVDAFE